MPSRPKKRRRRGGTDAEDVLERIHCLAWLWGFPGDGEYHLHGDLDPIFDGWPRATVGKWIEDHREEIEEFQRIKHEKPV